jgi:hypothetical protein
VAILRQAGLELQGDDRSSEARGHSILLVPDPRATWGDILAAAMTIAPDRCLGASLPPECEEPWVTLWLNRR